MFRGLFKGSPQYKEADNEGYTKRNGYPRASVTPTKTTVCQ